MQSKSMLRLWLCAIVALQCAIVATAQLDAVDAVSAGDELVSSSAGGLVTLAPTATPAPTVDPALLKRKAELCAMDLDDSNKPLNLLKVPIEPNPASRPNRPYPRIFCFVNTISTHLSTRAQAIADTWAQRCDKLIFFSNETNTLVSQSGSGKETTFEVVKLKVNAAYNHLWDKHRASLQYVYENYRHDFDWFYKADDDAYLIFENLRAYLSRPEIVMNQKRIAMQLGHRFNVTVSAANYYIRDDAVRKQFWKRFDRLVFNSGGCGYIMNRLYLDQFVQAIPEKTCMSDAKSKGVVADDVAISFCMMWYDVYPWDTRDHRGRERWHAFNPRDTYGVTKENAQEWWVNYHKNIGGFKGQDECCAPDSVGYHYVRPDMQYQIERQLYFCRTGDDVPDVDTFNRKYSFTLGKKVGIHPRDPKP